MAEEQMPAASDEERFLAALSRAMAKASHVRFDLGWGQVVCLVANLQLALRHPDNVGHPGRQVRSFLDHLFQKIEEIDAELAELLKRGDDPAHDQHLGDPGTGSGSAT